ncbi:pilus assembly FimT family protein [Desulfonatronum lacustre]|uniref:pilus assembly FimT family protein n=1 Tax=Desulfonatronum lacustre TaxID=66849 RepID=UPI0004B2BD81|nr:prepilin-type N-terminal cleavage/methylation domain-containing protein [Desulfonatronum lacustre]
MVQKKGSSIIEVLVVVAIAAILTTIAIPAFNVFIGNTRTSAVANESFCESLKYFETSERFQRSIVSSDQVLKSKIRREKGSIEEQIES